MSQVLRLRNLTATAVVLLLGLVLCGALASAAPAATYTVDLGTDTATPNDCTGAGGDCTLRGAIIKANADAAPDVIDFSVATVTIAASLPNVTQPLTINGGGSADVDGSGTYESNCTSSDYAIDTTAAATQILGLAIHDVCGRAVRSNLAAPTIQVGPRRADNTVSINGAAPNGSVEIYRSDTAGEGDLRFQSAITASGGGYSYPLGSLPAPSDKFTAIATDVNGVGTNFSALAGVPADLTSPALVRAVAISNNSVRLDFNEYLGFGSVVPASFNLVMGGVRREITGVNVNGTSVYISTLTTPWATGEAGAVTFTGSGRVADVSGNELLGEGTATVYAGPGELTLPTITKFRANPSRFCRAITRKCTKRKQTYLYLTLSKPSRVVFNVYRATKPRRFVLSFVHKYQSGTSRSRMLGTMSGRTMPSGKLVVQAVAQDAARNYSLPVEAAFRLVTRNSQF